MIEIAMSDAQFASAAARLLQNGIELNGPTGMLTKEGITANYRHEGGKLMVEIVDRPALLPLSLIETKLLSYLQQSVAYDSSKSLI
jgi:hypothetical protein